MTAIEKLMVFFVQVKIPVISATDQLKMANESPNRRNVLN